MKRPMELARCVLVAILRPAIVLLDIHLPDLDGLAVAEELATIPRRARRCPDLKP